MIQKIYKTSFGFADRQDIDKSVYEMIEKTMQSTPLFRNKQLFFQYVILLYMGGKRRIEPFLMPVTIYKQEDDKIKYYEIKSGLAKHFKGGIIKCNQCNQIFKIIKAYKMHKKQIHKEQEESNSNKHLYSHYGQRKYIESPIIADNEYEHAMMQYLLQGRQRVIIDFTPLLPPRARKLNYEELMSMEYNSNIFSGLTLKFKMFKLSITDGTKIIENTNIVPHMLRHMRAYDAKIIHKYSNSFIQKMFGWNREEMVSYYNDILNMLGAAEQIEEIKQHKAMQAFR